VFLCFLKYHLQGECCSSKWSEWSNYSLCTKSCGGGIKSRPWSCRQAGIADQIESVACNESFCNYYTHGWGNWGPCSVSCGIGVMTRTRYCPEGTGSCANDGDDPCNNIDNKEFVAGNKDCARCDMVRQKSFLFCIFCTFLQLQGECCYWDWSGWTSCCNSGNSNIRLRFKATSCGQDWEYIQKPCELRPA